MFAIMGLAAVVGLVWMFWSPGMGFAAGFASLLERPVGSRGPGQFLFGRESVGGEYRGRPVLLVLHHKRGRYQVGYLVVAMKTDAAFAPQQSFSLREHVVDPDARKAWDSLELDEEVRLSWNGGWMRATWQPTGFTIFPGPFDPAKWKRVLEAMLTVVSSLK